MTKEIKLYLIIAFLLGLVASDFVYAFRVPDIILPDSVNVDLQEKLDYIVDILNNGQYAITVSSAAIASTDNLAAGVPVLDDNGVNKYLCISNGTINYRVEVTAIP